MKMTYRTFKTTDNRGCEFKVTRYTEPAGFNANMTTRINIQYVAEVGGQIVKAASLKEIKDRVSQIG